MQTYLTKTWLVLILAGGAGYGQGLDGSISGNVSDRSGSPIPGADISLTNVATTQARQTRSDANGDFVFTQILPGTFKMTVAANGFKRYEQNDIIVTATERVALKRIELQLGVITEMVEVHAESARLQTQSAERTGRTS